MEGDRRSHKSVLSLFRAQIAESEASDRGFGLLFAVIFLTTGLAPLRNGGEPAWWAVACGAALALVAATVPKVLRRPKLAWLFLGFCLGLVVSPIVLGALFFLVVTPVGLIRRAFGGDPLRLRRGPRLTTYWRARADPPSSMADQF